MWAGITNTHVNFRLMGIRLRAVRPCIYLFQINSLVRSAEIRYVRFMVGCLALSRSTESDAAKSQAAHLLHDRVQC